MNLHYNENKKFYCSSEQIRQKNMQKFPLSLFNLQIYTVDNHS